GNGLCGLAAAPIPQQDTLHQRGDAGDEPWSSFRQHEDDGFAGSCGRPRQVELAVGEDQIADVSGAFGICIFAETEDNGIYARCRGFQGRGIIVGGAIETLYGGGGNAIGAQPFAKRVHDGLAVPGVPLFLVSLPGVAPAPIESGNTSGGGPGNKDMRGSVQGQDVTVIL